MWRHRRSRNFLFEGAASALEQRFADVVARTAIGEIPISNVPLNVTSSLKGINSFGNTARLEDLRIIGSGTVAGNQYINVDLTAVLHNPSNISLQTNDISLAVFYGDVKIGRAAINILNLVPGMNTIPTEFHFQPDHVNDTAVQRFLSEFTQSSDALALSIKGDPSSTPYASLVAALETISLTTSLTGLNVPPIITQINVYIPFSVIFDNLVFVDFDISNPLDTEIHVMFVQADARVNGETYAHFGQRFSNFAIPAKGTANSGKFGNVVLTNGTLRALAIIPSARLDVFCATTIMIGDDGYTIPWLRLTQPNVLTTYDLAGLSPDDLKRAFTNLMGKSPAAVDVARHIGSRDGSVSSVQATNARGRVASDRLPMRQTSVVRAD
ncbi:hypothetical protein F5148DRAFT_769468 [Russula earlei]|uniref:Uncharacterized protein n=1 Tax=Russula earlei TaxID=71964 RepID=A0ACC0TSU4_9AGAM|nr:hypothetical protein F5148DRAFT_769468 [Russula earlei]